MISINLFSVVDLGAAFVAFFSLMIFSYRSLRLEMKDVEVLFSLQVFFVMMHSLFIFMSDNVVPRGVNAASISNASIETLWWCRLMYINGGLALATIIHFVIRYTKTETILGLRVGFSGLCALYVGSFGVGLLSLLPGFLSAPSKPAHETSSFLYAVPWQPELGPLSWIYTAVWLSANGYAWFLLSRHTQSNARSTKPFGSDFVTIGVKTWGFGAFASMAMAAFGYSGVDISMVFVIAGMVCVTLGLIDEHVRSDGERAFATSFAHTEKIKIFARFLYLSSKRDVFSIKDIKQCYSLFGAEKPDNIQHYVTLLLKKNPAEIEKTAGGYSLVSLSRDAKNDGEILLSEMSRGVSDPIELVFIDEALKSLAGNAPRSAIVMTWNLAFDHLCKWIFQHHRDVFNRSLHSTFPNQGKQIEVLDDFYRLRDFEIIQCASSARIISSGIKKILLQKLERRNMAAHTFQGSITLLQAEEFVSDLICNVIQKLSL